MVGEGTLVVGARQGCGWVIMVDSNPWCCYGAVLLQSSSDSLVDELAGIFQASSEQLVKGWEGGRGTGAKEEEGWGLNVRRCNIGTWEQIKPT